ncbi:MAG: hypothetical protein ACE5EM_08930 [Sphingomonadales bacterium]
MRTIWLTLLLTASPLALAENADYGGLPEGSGREAVFNSCDACHSIRLVMQQGLTRDAWDETLDWMISEQGMPGLAAEERELILDYLVKNFGPAGRR